MIELSSKIESMKKEKKINILNSLNSLKLNECEDYL